MTKFIHHKYDSYCVSDSIWIIEYPKSWEQIRLKDTIEFDNSVKLPQQLKSTDLIEFVPMSNVNENLGIIAKYNYVPLKDVISGYTKFKNDDVIFAKITPCMENGNCAIVRNLVHNIGFGSTEFMVFRAKPKLTSEYLHYFLHNDLFLKNAEPYMKGTAGQKRITSLYMLTHTFLLPPLPEQTAIANYLDEKTALIDKKINLLTQKADKYKELKQALINETVTRGLDKNVKLKDSGVEWIGEIPEHWEVNRIGTAFNERSEKVNDTDYPPLSVTMQGIVPQLETAAKTDHNDNRRKVAVGDYVINSRSDRRGSSGLSNLEGSVSVINIVLKPQKNFSGKFIHHLFRSYRFIEEFYRVGRGIVDDLWTTKYSVMKAIEFAYPSLEEQTQIAEYLDKKTSQIDKIVESINNQIEKLKELRKTLINDVVTGKIKVT